MSKSLNKNGGDNEHRVIVAWAAHWLVVCITQGGTLRKREGFFCSVMNRWNALQFKNKKIFCLFFERKQVLCRFQVEKETEWESGCVIYSPWFHLS